MSKPESHSQTSDEGRWIRRLVVALPVGTIILGALSFVIYFENKERKEERTYRHALGLRRDLSTGEISRHLGIIGETTKLTPAERAATLASYLESSLSPDNMGYDVKRHTADERDAISASLRGTRRPGDVVVVVAAYSGGEEDDRALAVLLALAQSLTGMPEVRTIEFVSLRAGSVQAMQRDFAEIESSIRPGGGRITQFVALGPAAASLAAARLSQDVAAAITLVNFPSADPGELVGIAEKTTTAIRDAAAKL